MEWESFILSDVFDISSTNSGIDKNKLKNVDVEGYIPYITRTDKNNGVDDFIMDQDYELNDGNVITIGLDTQTVFYQPHSFYTGQNIQVLSNKHLNKYVGLYFVNLLKSLLEKFNWGGNGATLTRLKNSRILLPVNDVGVPDYDFMEEYMKNIEKEQIDKYKAYIGELETGLSVNVSEKLNNIVWKEFFITDIGTVKSGKDITQKEMIPGDTPYISSTSLNNGVKDFVKNTNNTLESNCISINRNGSVGYAFYHPYYAIFSNDCRKLIVGMDKYVSLFIANQIKLQKEKYNYSYKMGTNRIKRQKIMLPSDDKGNPDYMFMSDYMLYLERSLLERYLDFLY